MPSALADTEQVQVLVVASDPKQRCGGVVAEFSDVVNVRAEGRECCSGPRTSEHEEMPRASELQRRSYSRRISGPASPFMRSRHMCAPMATAALLPSIAAMSLTYCSRQRAISSRRCWAELSNAPGSGSRLAAAPAPALSGSVGSPHSASTSRCSCWSNMTDCPKRTLVRVISRLVARGLTTIYHLGDCKLTTREHRPQLLMHTLLTILSTSLQRLARQPS